MNCKEQYFIYSICEARNIFCVTIETAFKLPMVTHLYSAAGLSRISLEDINLDIIF